jgi:hypothetical protein
MHGLFRCWSRVFGWFARVLRGDEVSRHKNFQTLALHA